MCIGTSDNSRRYTGGAGQFTLILGACLGAGQILGLLGVPQIATVSTVVTTPSAFALVADATLDAAFDDAAFDDATLDAAFDDAALNDTGFAAAGLPANEFAGTGATGTGAGAIGTGTAGADLADVGFVDEPLGAAPRGASVVPEDRVTSADRYVVAASVGTPAQLQRQAAKQTARQRVVAEAVRLRGRPYQYGAAGPAAFDCSGFTKYVYRKVGRVLPHNANLQQRRGLPVARTRALPGDLLVFRNGSYGFHAAIYAGGGYMYDAPRPGTRVGRHKIWSRNYVVRRLV